MYNDFSRGGGNGQFLMALDVARWMDREIYFARFDGLAALLRGSGENVLLPGEIRWQRRTRALAEGVELDARRWASVQLIASTAGVTFNPAP